MEIRNLKTFVTAADLLNFTQTSRELGYSQSNISTQIQQMEDELGFRLFDRIGRSVSLTQHGQEMLPFARQIVNLAEQMENTIRPEKELGGIVRLGLCQSVFDVCFDNLYRLYHTRFPRVRIDVEVHSTERLLDLLKKNRLDLACLIDKPLPRHEWKIRLERAVKIGVVLSPQHALASRKELTVEDLKEHNWVLMEESAPYNLLLYPMFQNFDMEARIRLRLESCETAARVAARGEHVSFLPEYSVRKLVREGVIRFLPLQNYEQQMVVQLVLHRGKVETPQILAMGELLGQAMEQISDSSE